jgi:hypothetical protein
MERPMLPPKWQELWNRLFPEHRRLIIDLAESMADENTLRETLRTGRPTQSKRTRILKRIKEEQSWRAAVESGNLYKPRP